MFDIIAKERVLGPQEEVFLEIWNERPHVSEVSGVELNYNFSPSMYFVFSHVLSKGACPKLKLDKRFILLKTFEEHQMWEFHRHKIKHLPEWSKVFNLLEEAKIECNK